MKENGMTKFIEKVWMIWAASGALSIVFGLLAMFLPELTLDTFLILIGYMVVTWGVLWLMYGFSQIAKFRLWWLQSALGALVIFFGVYLVQNLNIGASLFAFVVSMVLLALSVVYAFVGAYVDRGAKWLWWGSAILGFIAVITVWMYPKDSSVAFIWVVGLYALINGAITLVRAFAVRTKYKELLKKAESVRANSSRGGQRKIVEAEYTESK